MTERKLSGIVAIHPYDDPRVLEQQLRLQELYDKRPEMVEPMKRKLARLQHEIVLATKARRHEEIAAGKVVGKTQKGVT